MVGLFVRLKLTLLRNALRGNWQRAAGLVGAVLLAVPITVLGFGVLAAGGRHETIGPLSAVLVFTGVFAGWLLLPVLAFGTDETLDPARLTLLPVSRRDLIAGLAVASVVGVPGLATAVALTGGIVGFTRSPGSFVVAIAAVALELGLCVAGCRALTTMLSAALSSRRGRDVSLMVASLLGVMAALSRPLAAIVGPVTPEDLHLFVGVLRWSPPGLAGHALVDGRDGNWLIALGELAGAAISLVLLAWIWRAALDRTTAGRGGAVQPARRREPSLFPAVVAFLPRTRTGAVAAKELRYLGRDPRRRAMFVSGILVGFSMPVGVALSGPGAHPRMVLFSAFTAFILAQQASNQFGTDGRPLWAHVAAGNDPRADLTGKNIAAALAAVPAVAAVAGGLAAVSDGWAYLPAALALAATAMGVGLGVGNVVSVRAPLAVPESSGTVWAGGGGGQGCTAALMQFGSLAATGALVAPPVVAVIMAQVWWPVGLAVIAPVAVAYGVLVWRIGLRIAANWVWWRLPELLEAVEPRRGA